ncbi:MAG TPA: sialidase family protein [Amycolatopsis sp.]|uniref:sialidase family protein n=1 Tax=Amycolatopsis sp. TaxID=37632 RepID=UPI002B465F70|nr:sialidase family protein [Amycolatopsis sp.]HKS49523.1 sialidase family protein [Amycolatopsis sp.]
MLAVLAAGTPAAAATGGMPHNPLLKERFAEGGDDDLGDEPAVSALCQSYLGKPSPYRPLFPNVDMISGDTTVPVGAQAGCGSAQNETPIAVNPENPRNLVAGANDYRVFNARENRNDASGYAYTTFDGGQTWKDVQLPHLVYQTGAAGALSYMDSAGDPAIAFGPHGTVYYSNLVFSRADVPANQQQASGIAVSVSHDGGLSWGDPVILRLDGVTPQGTPAPTSIFNDKEWIAADPRSGTVYVTWTQFTYDSAGNFVESPVVASTSHDFGRTWSGPVRISPSMSGFTGGITSFGTGTSPQVANDGTLYVAYESSVCATAACDQKSDHDAIVLATSRDGGRSFQNKEVATDYDFPVNEDTGDSSLTGENFRIDSFPQLAYDRTVNHLWVTWADDRNGQYDGTGKSVKTQGDVIVSDAVAGGPWSKPSVIHGVADEVFPAVAVFGNRVAVTFYTRSYDPKGIGLDYAYTVGWGSSVAAAPIRRITTQTANPQVQFPAIGAVSGDVLQGLFIGDYTGAVMGSDFLLHPVWTDFRGSPGTTTPNQDAVTAAIPALY